MANYTTGRIIVPVALATFITSLDNTVANVALPAIQRDLVLTTSQVEWTATAYILTFSALLLAGGKLADRHGRRLVMSVGLIVFGVGSILAGLATNSWTLIGMRALQGVGGALVMPASLAIIAADIEPRHRHRASAIWTAAVALALAVGPAAGGVITQYLGWPWIFYLNVPIVVLTVLLAYSTKVVEVGNRRSRIDVAGVLSSGGALALLTWVLIQASAHGWGSLTVIAAGAGAVVMASIFVFVERSSENPMLPGELFRSRVFNSVTVAQVLWGLALTGVSLFTSLFLQNVLRFSPTQAGLTFVPLAVTLILTVPVASVLFRAFGAQRVGAAALSLVGLGLVLVAGVGTHGTFVQLLPGLLAIGVGSGLTAPLVAEALSVVPEGMEGLASAVTSAARELAGVLGVAVTGAIVVTRQKALLNKGVDEAHAFTSGYQWGLRSAAGLMLIAAVVAYWGLRGKATADMKPKDASGVSVP